MLLPTGVKLYNCEVCLQGFGQKNSLKKHLQTSHPNLARVDDDGDEGGSSSYHKSQASPTGSTNSNSSTLSVQHLQHRIPPQTHPIPLINQQQLHIMSAFHHQPH